MGYHKRVIKRGSLGTLSKLTEELEEAIEAEEQGVRLLVLCELADLVGALNLYLKSAFPGMEIEDLIRMSQLTEEAFKDGTRN